MSVQKEEENLQGSWVELHFNPDVRSISGGVQTQSPPPCLEPDLEKMLLDAQHESSRSSSKGSSKGSSQCNSPLRAQTPPYLYRASEGTSSQSEEDYQERRGEWENQMKKNADGMWHWSSRPENNPPRELQLKHPRRSSSLSMRNTSVMKKGGVLSADFLKLVMPSLILSHILALGLGIYIGRRLTVHSAY